MIAAMTPERVALIKEKCTEIEKTLAEVQVHTAAAACLSLAARYIAWLLVDDKLKLPENFVANTVGDFISTIEANIGLLEQGGKFQ